FNRRQPGARPVFLIGVMLFPDLTALQGERIHLFADQKARAFIKADDRVLRIMRQPVEPSEALHLGDELGVDLAHPPGLVEMRLQFVLFRILPTWTCEMRSLDPNSTTFSASNRRLQRACPSGA